MSADLIWEHLTPKGVFRISHRWIARNTAIYELWLDEQFIAPVAYPDSGAEQLCDGLFDEKIGFSAKTLSIPRRVDLWRPHWQLGPDGSGS